MRVPEWTKITAPFCVAWGWVMAPLDASEAYAADAIRQHSDAAKILTNFILKPPTRQNDVGEAESGLYN